MSSEIFWTIFVNSNFYNVMLKQTHLILRSHLKIGCHTTLDEKEKDKLRLHISAIVNCIAYPQQTTKCKFLHNFLTAYQA